MGVLHELLPALNEAEMLDKKMFDETKQAITKKELLDGFRKTLKMHDDERKAEEEGAGEFYEITTSVMDRLLYQKDFQVRNLDAQLQREVANCTAKADLELPNGKKITGLPVTFLLYLEKYLTKYRELLNHAVTLQPGVDWVEDPHSPLKGAWKSAEPTLANKTEKEQVPIILAPATDKHQANAQLIVKERTVGCYAKTLFTGRLSPLQKHQLMTTCDETIKRVKQAKAQANLASVGKEVIGKDLIECILGV